MKRNIVWNLTKLCVWNCPFCCVDAKYVGFNARNILEQCEKASELALIEKKQIIDMLSHGEYSIDFSGGELLINPENVELIKYASQKLGKDNIGISVSGAFIDEKMAQMLSETVNEVEISLDYIPFSPYKYRPIGYHEYVSEAVKNLKKYNVPVGIQTVLLHENMERNTLKELFCWIEENKIDSWSLLRFFKSGRGENIKIDEPTHKEYAEVVEYIKNLTAKSNVDIHFQYLLPNHEGYTLKCRAVRKSIGILPDGRVTGCFWALGKDMSLKDERFLLGKLPEETIEQILESKNAKFWLNECDQCQFFSKDILEK